MQSEWKEVDFNKYCPSCKFNTEVDKDGYLVLECELCLCEPMLIGSHKPINYKEARK